MSLLSYVGDLVPHRRRRAAARAALRPPVARAVPELPDGRRLDRGRLPQGEVLAAPLRGDRPARSSPATRASRTSPPAPRTPPSCSTSSARRSRPRPPPSGSTASGRPGCRARRCTRCAEALADPQTAARELVLETAHPRFGTVRQLRGPVRVGAEPPPARRAPRRHEDGDATPDGPPRLRPGPDRGAGGQRRLRVRAPARLKERSSHGLRAERGAAGLPQDAARLRARPDLARGAGVGAVRPLSDRDRGRDEGARALRPDGAGVARGPGRRPRHLRHRVRGDLARVDGHRRHPGEPHAGVLAAGALRDGGAAAALAPRPGDRPAPGRARAHRAGDRQRPAGRRDPRRPGRRRLRRHRDQDVDHQRAPRRSPADPVRDRSGGDPPPPRAQRPVRRGRHPGIHGGP